MTGYVWPLIVTVAVEPAGTLPLRSGVVSLVLLSPFTPESVVGLKPTEGVTITVGITIPTVLLTSAPSVLTLPAASENLLLATLTEPLTALPTVGVKVAV